MGLTQGSGAAPAAWSAISTVIINTYKAHGYGAHFECSWSRVILIVAALLNTDLLHMSRDERISDSEVVANVQHATYYWAKLLQATGGNLNPKNAIGTYSAKNSFGMWQD